MSSAWRLPAAVHAVAVEEDIVFLDVQADSYMCLPGGADRLEVRQGSRRVEVVDDTIAEELAAAGLLERGGAEAEAPREFHLPPPRASAAPFETRRPGWSDVRDAVTAMAGLLTGYAGRPFADLILGAGASRPQAAFEPPTQDLLDIAVRFNGWAPYAPLPTKCLLRAFMLRRLLQRRGHEAAWVFGVTTWPFQAHCWIQRGDVVLDDTVERVRPFHRIMVI